MAIFLFHQNSFKIFGHLEYESLLLHSVLWIFRGCYDVERKENDNFACLFRIMDVLKKSSFILKLLLVRFSSSDTIHRLLYFLDLKKAAIFGLSVKSLLKVKVSAANGDLPYAEIFYYTYTRTTWLHRFESFLHQNIVLSKSREQLGCTNLSLFCIKILCQVNLYV